MNKCFNDSIANNLKSDGKYMKKISIFLLIFSFLINALPARADEGMWTFDNLPLKILQEKYGFTPTQAWVDHIRLSAVRLNDGGSGSFVSPNGLLLTNHHVARKQLQNASDKDHDYIKDGFYAPTQADEMKSADLEVNVLVGMENVTARVNAGTVPDQVARFRQLAGLGVQTAIVSLPGLVDPVPIERFGDVIGAFAA